MTSFTSNKRILAGEVYEIMCGSDGPLTARQLSEATGHTVREIVGALRILYDAGAVSKIEGQKCAQWVVPGAGALPRRDVRTRERSECRIRVISFMDRENRPMRMTEIAKGIGADLHLVSAILVNLRHDGKVRKRGRNPPVWELVR